MVYYADHTRMSSCILQDLKNGLDGKKSPSLYVIKHMKIESGNQGTSTHHSDSPGYTGSYINSTIVRQYDSLFEQ